jgi:hypothetical protein
MLLVLFRLRSICDNSREEEPRLRHLCLSLGTAAVPGYLISDGPTDMHITDGAGWKYKHIKLVSTRGLLSSLQDIN